MIKFFAVITSPLFWQQIEEIVKRKESQILHKCIDSNIDIYSELEKISRVSVKYLIIDVSSLADSDLLIKAIRRYRIKRDSKTRIIVIAPNCKPGDNVLSFLVTMGVYDIINPISDSLDDMIIIEDLLYVIDNPTPYAKAVKWDITAMDMMHLSNESDASKKVVEKVETIIKDKIVGTVVIAVAGTMHRIGTTHTVISISNYLRKLNFNVGLVEMHKSEHFNTIKHAYEDVVISNNNFRLNNLTFYPFNNELNLLDILDQGYNYLILDMGTYNKCDLNEFKRSHRRIIVSGVKDWELTELEFVLRENDSIDKNIYYFSFSDSTTFNFIKDNMEGLPCFLAPLNPDPFKVDDIKVFEGMLKSVLPSMDNNQNKRFISFVKKGGKK